MLYRGIHNLTLYITNVTFFAVQLPIYAVLTFGVCILHNSIVFFYLIFYCFQKKLYRSFYLGDLWNNCFLSRSYFSKLS